jgi:hypothetical protein
MSGKNCKKRARARTRRETTAMRLFGAGVRDGAAAYVRSRDLPALIALWPHELADETPAGALRVLAKLRHALRAERVRARGGHWSYDLNRYLALLSAYRGELARLGQGQSLRQGQSLDQAKRARRCGRTGAGRRP